MDSISQKCCSKCGKSLPNTADYFYRQASNPTGLNTECKLCKRAYDKQWLIDNPTKKSIYDKQYRQTHSEQLKTTKQQYRIDNAEYLSLYFHNHHILNRDERNNKTSIWRKKHPENNRKYIRDNREHIRICRIKRYKENPEITKIANMRRKTRINGLPSRFTVSDWQRCLEYWDNKCCICGRSPDFWHVLAKEHWIPVTSKRFDNPGTVTTNILPMCHSKKGVLSGDESCNNKKGNKDPIEWLYSVYDDVEALRIISAINLYFDLTESKNDAP